MASTRAQEYPSPIPVMAFEEWLFAKYSPREGGSDWDFADDRWYSEARNTYAEYIVRTWENPRELLVNNFSLDLIGRTLFEEVHVYARDDVPRPLRNRAWDAVANLFRELFEPFVSDSLSHLNESDPVSGLLDGACYMWWGEQSPYSLQYEVNEARDTEIFWEICIRSLQSGRPPLQESILHGLAHFTQGPTPLLGPQKVFDWFLAADLTARPELVEYAQLASLGRVQ